jgi:glucosamine--fructose-6-phosphate aminotransferase (isomerizing)
LVRACHARPLQFLCDPSGHVFEHVAIRSDRTVVIPRNEPELDPILLSVPLQILAYHAAVALDRDVDKPRNRAKSVTVE